MFNSWFLFLIESSWSAEVLDSFLIIWANTNIPDSFQPNQTFNLYVPAYLKATFLHLRTCLLMIYRTTPFQDISISHKLAYLNVIYIPSIHYDSMIPPYMQESASINIRNLFILQQYLNGCLQSFHLNFIRI